MRKQSEGQRVFYSTDIELHRAELEGEEFFKDQFREMEKRIQIFEKKFNRFSKIDQAHVIVLLQKCLRSLEVKAFLMGDLATKNPSITKYQDTAIELTNKLIHFGIIKNAKNPLRLLALIDSIYSKDGIESLEMVDKIMSDMYSPRKRKTS